MAEVLLFHHALGLTDGVRAFADRLRAAGHSVTTPDLYDGRRFETIDEGVAHANHVGMMAIADRGAAHATGLPAPLVVAGFSLGTLPAQKLAQTREGVVGAILYHGGDVPVSAFGERWPEGVALQLHLSERDAWVDMEAARSLVLEASGELFLYPSSGHLITDSSFHEYDAALTAQIVKRSLSFLAVRGS
jgi:dienelactone hydrolase